MAGRRGARSSRQHDRIVGAQCHGEAWRRVEEGDESITAIVDEIRRMAVERRHILVEDGGVAAGLWSADPARGVTQLLVAGILLRAASADALVDDVAHWVEVGRRRALQPPHTAS